MGEWVTDTKKIGLGLTAFGVIFLILGLLLFFDRPLLTLGNVLFIAGTILLIGPHKTVAYFTDTTKIRGTLCFLAGLVLVIIKFPILGMILELFGIVNLFGNFFPVILSFLRQIPCVGTVLKLPIVKKLSEFLAGDSILIGYDD